MNLTTVRPGAESLAWLGSRLAALKGGDPLAPVTVVVSSNHVGLATRRDLARRGYANVRFGVMGRLVEPLGSPHLAVAGKSPVTSAAEEAAIAEAIRRRGAGFGEVGAHPALVRTLRDLFRELRSAELDGSRLEGLGAWGRMAEAALDVYAEYLEIVRSAGLYDDQDLLAAAIAKLETHEAGNLAWEIGAVIVLTPAALQPAELRFLEALARHVAVDVALSWLGDEQADSSSKAIAAALGAQWPDGTSSPVAPPEVRLLAAPDATEEVKSVSRRLLALVDSGAQLRRIAIAYRDQDPYARLIRDTLDAADVSWAGIDGRPLAESWAGRGLLGLLRLRERDFARVDVLAWLGGLPEPDPGGVSIGDWDRLSRKAAVVRRARQWMDRLALQAKDTRAEADGMEHAGRSEGAIRYLRREAGALDRMASFVQRVDAETWAPAERKWPELVRWAEHVRRTFIPVADGWPEREREADEMIGELLAQMGSAGAIAGEVDIEWFVDSIQAAVERRRQAEGRLGSGVAVGPIGALHGLAFDHVFVLGATERALPRSLPPDPVFPPDGGPDPLGRAERRQSDERRDFLAAIAAADGGQVCLSFPAWDPDLRPSYPSPWVIAFAQSSTTAVPAASSLRAGRGAANIALVASPDAGLATAPASLNLAEWRAGAARLQGQNLDRSGLAARDDLPLRRHLQVRQARLSDGFTEFDGNVQAEVERIQHLAAGLGSQPHSASGIEAWAACPFSFLLDRVVGVEPTERPEQEVAWAISAAARGTLIHEILNRFFAELAQAGRPLAGEAYAPDDHRRIEEIAREKFASLETAGAVGHSLAWENERRSIVLDLHTFLRKDQELRADGLVPTFFEQGFGMAGDSWPELVLDVGGGRHARLRGRIDRVDLGPDPSAPVQARLIDYKTGRAYAKKDFEKDPVVAGTKAQPSLYAAAIRSRYPNVSVASGYWFASTRGGFEFLAVPDDPDRLRHVLDVMDRGLRAGAFPQVPGPDDSRRDRTSWANCFYCPFDRVCPTGRDQMRERKRGGEGPLIHLELGDGA